MGDAQNHGFQYLSCLIWKIWGYPQFRKLPYMFICILFIFIYVFVHGKPSIRAFLVGLKTSENDPNQLPTAPLTSSVPEEEGQGRCKCCRQSSSPEGRKIWRIGLMDTTVNDGEWFMIHTNIYVYIYIWNITTYIWDSLGFGRSLDATLTQVWCVNLTRALVSMRSSTSELSRALSVNLTVEAGGSESASEKRLCWRKMDEILMKTWEPWHFKDGWSLALACFEALPPQK